MPSASSTVAGIQDNSAPVSTSTDVTVRRSPGREGFSTAMSTRNRPISSVIIAPRDLPSCTIRAPPVSTHRKRSLPRRGGDSAERPPGENGERQGSDSADPLTEHEAAHERVAGGAEHAPIDRDADAAEGRDAQRAAHLRARGAEPSVRSIEYSRHGSAMTANPIHSRLPAFGVAAVIVSPIGSQ